MALSAATLAQIQSRGYNMGRINSWLSDNPDAASDDARALRSFPVESHGTAAAPAPNTGGSGGGGGTGTPTPTPPPGPTKTHQIDVMSDGEIVVT